MSRPYFSSRDNYFSMVEMEKLSIAHDLNVRVVYDVERFYFVLFSEKTGIVLGRSRRIAKIPLHSRLPRLSILCHSDRLIVENFG